MICRNGSIVHENYEFKQYNNLKTNSVQRSYKLNTNLLNGKPALPVTHHKHQLYRNLRIPPTSSFLLDRLDGGGCVCLWLLLAFLHPRVLLVVLASFRVADSCRKMARLFATGLPAADHDYSVHATSELHIFSKFCAVCVWKRTPL